MANGRGLLRQAVDATRSGVDSARHTLVWRVWERMLENEVIDRSVALAGKAFVSFFPLVVVVAAFMPPSIRSSITTTMTHQLGIQGPALTLVSGALSSSEDIRRATGILGLVLTFFFATSFTTALQRVYLRAWRRAPGQTVGAYARGSAWLVGLLVYMALMGGLRGLLSDGSGLGPFLVLSLAVSTAWWWFTAWFLLLRQVRWRVLLPTAAITCVTMSGYVLSASIWMPPVVLRNEFQFGFFGVALALVTWFSGAAICIIVGACAGTVLAEDTGPLGRIIRGREPGLLVDGAAPPLPPPSREFRPLDAIRSTDEESARPQ